GGTAPRRWLPTSRRGPAALSTSWCETSCSCGRRSLEADAESHVDVAPNSQRTEQPRQAANLVIGEIDRKRAADINRVRRRNQGGGDRDVAGHAVDGERAAERTSHGVRWRRW